MEYFYATNRKLCYSLISEDFLTLLDLDEIQLILNPHVGRLSGVVWPTWDRFIAEVPEGVRMDLDARAEANLLHRFMRTNAERELAGPGVWFITERGGFAVGFEGFPSGIDGMVVCRFKRLDNAGRSRTYPTQRAERLRNNSPDPELDGIPAEATLVDIGYVLNDLRTGYADVQAVRVVDTRWVMSIPRRNDGSISMPLPLFPPNGDPGDRTRRFSFIRPSRAANEESRD